MIDSRTGLIDYCLRSLGAPVLEINVDEEQVEDRIDEALQYYQEYHSDATLRTYLKHTITAADITNEHIQLDDNILFVKGILNIPSGAASALFNHEYQYRLSDLNQKTGDVLSYSMFQSHLKMVAQQFEGVGESVRFNRHRNQLHLDLNFDGKLDEGDIVIIDCYLINDPDEYTDTWNDMLLKELATSLIKRQWGQNLIKFEGMQMPGGVTINGRQLYDDAITEIQQIKETMQTNYEFPPDFYVG